MTRLRAFRAEQLRSIPESHHLKAAVDVLFKKELAD